jgi:hypothetical protein
VPKWSINQWDTVQFHCAFGLLTTQYCNSRVHDHSSCCQVPSLFYCQLHRCFIPNCVYVPTHSYGDIDVHVTCPFFFLVSWGGVRLSPLGTSATNCSTVPAPDDRWWVWSRRWNKNWQGKPKYSDKTFPTAALSTTKPTWPYLSLNPGRRGGISATNRLSYGTAM